MAEKQTTEFHENYTEINKNCKYEASGKRGNSNAE